MNLNINTAMRTAKTVLVANSPVLLVGTAIAGVVATGILAAKGGYKARGIIDAAEATATKPLDTVEKVKLTWLCYAAPAVTGASTIAATLGVHTIHSKRNAAMAGLYAVTAHKLDELRDGAEAMLTPKKIETLTNETAQKTMDRQNPNGPDFMDNEVIILGDGGELCYDELSARFFMGSMNKIDAAVLKGNHVLMSEGDLDLNDFYDFLGLPGTPMGENLGWSGPTITVKYGAVVTPDGRPAISMSFQESPSIGMGRL